MSVIIRLQNLPWSANAMDIRQFFKGLSIPEGGVHIVGGEMGDAFIAFSTDEDARQAMMHDRDKINEVQVRLLLSSRAEMQKVIETARQQSMLALQNAATMMSKANVAATVAPPATVAATPGVAAMRVAPQPPVITPKSLQKIMGSQLSPAPSFLAYQQQAGVTYNEKSLDSSDSPDSRRASSERRRRSDSRSPSRDRSRRRDRRDRSSRSRSREQEYKSRRSRRSRSRDRSRDRSRSRERERERERERDRERERERERNSHRTGARSSRNSRDRDESSNTVNTRPKQGSINPWNVPPPNSGGGIGYQVNSVPSPALNSPNPFVVAPPKIPFIQNTAAPAAPGFIPNAALVAAISNLANVKTAPNSAPVVNPLGMLPAFQTYTSNSSTAVVSAYNIDLFGNKPGGSAENAAAITLPNKLQTLQNPYTAATTSATATSNLLNAGNMLKRDAAVDALKPQQQPEPIAFASTNPYAQMYPNLFATHMPTTTAVGGGTSGTDSAFEQNSRELSNKTNDNRGDSVRGNTESSSIQVSNICPNVTYSDLRRFFYGLYIAHNGIKLINDRHGQRAGVAFIQFSRSSFAVKALTRNNSMLKSKPVRIESVPDADFLNAEDSFRPQSRSTGNGGSGGDDRDRRVHKDGIDKQSERGPREELPFSVLFVKEIPGFATEQDVMKMFSAYTIIDILLTPSPDNRRENIAHVRFSRDEDAKAALANEACHIIAHRKVRVSAGTVEHLDRAKEKLRLANEQLLKEEQAMAEQEEAARKEAEATAAAKAQEEEEEAAAAEAVASMRPKRRDGDDEPQLIEDSDVGASNPGDGGHDSGEGEDEYMPTSVQQQTQSQPQQQRDMRDPRQRRQSRFDSVPPQQAPPQPQYHPNDNNNCPPMSGNHMNMPMGMMLIHNNNNNNNMNNNGGNMNNQQECFVIMKNCLYNTRINDIGGLLMMSNLRPKHVEMLRNDRNLPSGEFIVEFRDALDADIAIKDFNNTQFRGRNLRVYTIRPQQIADRLGKPFMNYFPGGDGQQGGGNFGPNGPNMMMDGGGGMRCDNNRGDGGGSFNGGNLRKRGSRSRNRRGGRNNRDKSHGNPFDQDMDDDMDSNDDDNGSDDDMGPNNDDGNGNGFNGPNNNGGGGGGGDGIPPKFNQPGCVIAMENVPFRADLKAIMRFFNEYDISPDDIIRRFNDDGSPTGDARVAFPTPEQARAAFESKRRKHIFNRTVYLSLL